MIIFIMLYNVMHIFYLNLFKFIIYLYLLYISYYMLLHYIKYTILYYTSDKTVEKPRSGDLQWYSEQASFLLFILLINRLN